MSNYKVFFRFTEPAILPGNFQMNGPVIETDANGKYTFILNNIPSGILYHAKIYVYDVNFHRVEKTLSFYANGCNYNVTTIFITPYNSFNTYINFEVQNGCNNCPAFKNLINTSSPNLVHSDFVKWFWKSGNHCFSQLASAQYFISSPQGTSVELQAKLTDPYTNYTFLHLTISKNLVNDAGFFFHVGGQIFSGAFPVSTSGVVLYRKINNTYIPADTMIVSTFGYYYFTNIPDCSYIIKVYPEPDQMKSNNYLPTYYSATSSWSAATTVHRYNTGNTLTVNLIPSVQLTGAGKIYGNVFYPGQIPANRCEILLYNSNLQPLQYQISNTYGEFEFDKLPFGTYYLTYEIPGINQNLYTVTIQPNNPVAHTELIIGQPAQVQNMVSGNLVVYPNPFHEVINIRNIGLLSDETVGIKIYSITGSVVFQTETSNLVEEINVALPFLKQGIYLIEVTGFSTGTTMKQRIQKL